MLGILAWELFQAQSVPLLLHASFITASLAAADDQGALLSAFGQGAPLSTRSSSNPKGALLALKELF